MPLSGFHPAIARWFTDRFAEPTEPQRRAWPLIQGGRNALIAAPTGSGKTFAAFLAAIDSLLRQGLDGTLGDETQVVYVSPLKALSNDVQKNLAEPLAEIRGTLEQLCLPDVDIRTLVRTGDTPAPERQQMVKRPPHVLVTTPESLYLILTSERARDMLRTVRTVIVDEIHAVARDKRGSHLALSLERLEHLAGRSLQRIGLSATQKPSEEIAAFLAGIRHPTPDTCIIDSGHARQLDLAIEIPSSPLEAVMAAEVWEELYDRLAQLIGEHRTTLVFVNTRRLAERMTMHLSERLGAEHVTSHHGSLSRDKRLEAEQRLKEGKLKALVATASLELGIDIGAVDLVCQIGSTRSIATLLQRVGRSGHHLGAVPKGRIFPLSRDELIECAALVRAARERRLDRLIIPGRPLDILAQQLVAAVACEEWDEGALYELVRGAYPYRDLSRKDFDDVVQMLAEGFTTRRGRRGAYVHYDGVNGRLRARRGARLAAITSGGAIPDIGDYRVVLEPTDTFVGTLNEDFAIESMPGDVFQLGNTSYLIRKIESGQGARPAEALLPQLQFRAAGRGDRGCDRPLARASAQLPARGRIPVLEARDGRGAARPGDARRADVPVTLALERHPGTCRAAPARWEEGAHPAAADGGRRPGRGDLSRSARLPREPGGRPGDPRPSAREADDRGLPARGDGLPGTQARARGDGGGALRARRARHGGAVAPVARGAEREAVRVPGRRPAGGAPHPGRDHSPRARREDGGRARQARPGGDRPGEGRSLARRQLRGRAARCVAGHRCPPECG